MSGISYFYACTKCHNIIIKSLDNGDLQVYTKTLRFRDGNVHAVCTKCSTDLRMPLRFEETMLKSLEPKLYLVHPKKK